MRHDAQKFILRFVGALQRDRLFLQLFDFLSHFFEEPGILQSQRGLICKRLYQRHFVVGVSPSRPVREGEGTNDFFVRSKGRRVAEGGCPRGDLRVRIVGRDATHVVGADFRIGRRRLARVVAKAPISERLRRPHLSAGRRYLLRVRAELRDGRFLTLDRRLRACGP